MLKFSTSNGTLYSVGVMFFVISVKLIKEDFLLEEDRWMLKSTLLGALAMGTISLLRVDWVFIKEV